MCLGLKTLRPRRASRASQFCILKSIKWVKLMAIITKLIVRVVLGASEVMGFFMWILR